MSGAFVDLSTLTKAELHAEAARVRSECIRLRGEVTKIVEELQKRKDARVNAKFTSARVQWQ